MKPLKTLFSLLCFFFFAQNSQAQLTANFTASTTNGCSPIVVNFSDLSTGNPTEWKWDLGNGTLSTLQNPSATYVAPGFYTIKLRVKSGNGTDSVTRTNYIQVFNLPTVDFSAGNTAGCVPVAVTFTDNSTFNDGNITSRQWDFGDGILSNDQNPQHIYTQPGNFNVTLKVTASNGCSGNLRKSSFISTHAVKASFINFGFSTCSPNKIVFQNESTGDGALQYSWQFGDGTYSSESNPVHTYTAAGAYTIKLIIRNQFGCMDSMAKNTNVSMPLTASFMADNIVNCKVPATVQFTNQTTGSNSYDWDFGDGTFSSTDNPVHVFKDTGAYSIKLVARNANGCRDSLLINNYIKAQKAYVNFLGLPDSGCIPFTKYFSADIYSYDSIVDYSWQLGNGILLPGASPSYTFTIPGNYNLSLITTSRYGCKDTSSLLSAVKVGNKPVARFSEDIRNTCARQAISFTDLSTGHITSWKWDFGDQAFSTDKNPTHVFSDTGWMTVSLTVRDGGCSDIAVYSRHIYIKPAVAKFEVEMECDSPYKRKFNNLSLGAMRWQWDFGDGSFSTAFSPEHTFPGQGTFLVTLQVWNDSTGCNYSSKQFIKITNVSSNFFATDTVVCKGETVHFNAVPNREITRYQWNFGDGNYLTTVVPAAAHLFTNPGSYLIKLTTTDSLGCTHVILKSNYIKIGGPKAKAVSETYNICLNTPVTFIDSSILTSPIKKWEWEYGDGTSETVFSPPFSHAYLNAGSYNPFVKITDSMGCSDTFRIIRPIIAQRIVPNIYISDSVACPGSPLRFVCPYSVPGISYRWDFGDGQTSALQMPYHFYNNEGVYTVKLYMSILNKCADSNIIINAVRVKQTRAYFTVSDSFSSCPPLLVRFTGNPVSAVGEYWDFGDSTYTNTLTPSHYYTYPGEYTAKLIAKGHGSCADTMMKKIIINGPKGSITSNRHVSCKPYSYNFIAHTENAVSYVWDFNDGVTQNQSDTMVAHTYIDSGKFVPKIILEDMYGCRVPVPSKDTLTNIFVNPRFSFSDSIVCSGENISFTQSALSNDFITAYKWGFGDSAFSIQPNPRHAYLSTGNFYPSLMCRTSAGCENFYQSDRPVKVLPSPAVSMVATSNGCAPLFVSFNVFCSDTDSSTVKWKWQLGQGDTSALQSPPEKKYTVAGDYAVSVSATNTEGCISTVHDTIHVYPAASTAISGDSILCMGETVTLRGNGASRYQWYNVEGLVCDTCNIIAVHPVATTDYTLTGVSEHGCSSSDTLKVNVYQPIRLQYDASANICKGGGALLGVSGASHYRWYPSDGLSSNTSSQPMAKPGTTTEYTVVGYDNAGCFKDSGQIKVTVHDYPVVKACGDKTVSAGTPVSLEAVYSNDVTEIFWSPNDNLSRYDSISVIVKPKENTEYTVKVKNAAGCGAEDKVTVFVTCSKNNVFVPNLFSPNNDGVNDVFYPRGTGLLKIQTMRIFNRWGETVFEKKSFNANDPSAGWDGTFKGSKLGSDVFVYVMDLICENSSMLSLQGNVSLMK